MRTEPEAAMPSQLVVDGLPIDFDERRLRSLFERFGQIESAVVMKTSAGHVLRFGYVTFASDEEAEQARQALDGAEVEGRRIAVAYPPISNPPA